MNNKGFSVVELIVVSVILALLVGVTIGSIYRYVNQTRVTTDIDNAASIQSVLAPVVKDVGVNKSLDKGQKVTITWSEQDTDITKADTEGDASDKAKKAVAKKVKALMPDGLPESKSKGSFKIEVKKDNENITVTCTAYSDTSASDGNELKW